MKKPIRIAYLVNEYPKVSHSFIRREILSLERQGFEIKRISLRGWDNTLVDEKDINELSLTRFVLRDGPLPIIRVVIKCLMENPRKFFTACKMALKIGLKSTRPLPYHFAYVAEACQILIWLKQSKVEHLHAHFGDNSAEIALLVKLLGGPSYSFTVHGQDEVKFGGLREKVHHAAFVISISSFGRGLLFHQLPIEDWPTVKIVHCGIENNFNLLASQTPFPNRPAVVCVGRLCAEKGQLLLLKAASVLANRGLTFRLTLAGDGEMRAKIEEEITRLELNNHVVITGWLNSNEVRDIILASRGLVLPSFTEGLPVVLIEAMALGRPVISTYIGGIPELVISGENGWLIPAGSIAQLTEALEEMLLKKPKELELMGNTGRIRAMKRHSIDIETAKLESFIIEAIRNNSERLK